MRKLIQRIKCFLGLHTWDTKHVIKLNHRTSCLNCETRGIFKYKVSYLLGDIKTTEYTVEKE